MFRSILVPLDQTPLAETALPYASRLAREGGSRLHLVLAHQLTAVAGMGELAFLPAEIEAELHIRERAYLSDTAADLVLNGLPKVGYHEALGPAGDAVCQEAARVGADLIVMGTHGRGAVGRFWHGSVADHVVRNVECPVILLPPGSRKGFRPKKLVRGILVALDLSRESAAVLTPVAEIARLTGAPVTLLHVVLDPILEPAAYPMLTPLPEIPPVENRRADATRHLEALAAELRTQGLSVSIEVKTGVNAARILSETLNGSRFDLLAMTTHGRGGLKRLWLGSVASKVLEDAAKPLLVLHPRRPA
jgi:nucleotide-binding universal stress UspA family protein